MSVMETVKSIGVHNGIRFTISNWRYAGGNRLLNKAMGFDMVVLAFAIVSYRNHLGSLAHLLICSFARDFFCNDLPVTIESASTTNAPIVPAAIFDNDASAKNGTEYPANGPEPD